MTIQALSEHSLSRRFALVNDLRMHYWIGGKGEPVVLLHGWPATSYEWRKVMPMLAERYTVIAPDMRGLGDTSKPALGYDKRTVASDIYQLVRSLGFESVRLVGHDQGGAVAYAYAAAHPESVSHFAFLESLLAGYSLELAMDVGHGGSWHFGFTMLRDLSEALVAGRERMFLSWFFHGDPYIPGAITEADIDEYTRCYAAPGGIRAGFEYYRTIPQDAADNREWAGRKLPMPVLALGADHGVVGDRTISEMEQVAEHVQGGIITDCGHWVADEQPEQLLKHLFAFFTH
jgi:pimeloyl-ACP methyl ester carboxylesterase